MASEWVETRLGEVTKLYDSPHQTAPLNPAGDVTYLNVGDVVDGRITHKLSGRLDDETAAVWNRRTAPQTGDLVFGYEAKVGHAALIPNHSRWALGRRLGLLRPDMARVEPRFLLYAWYSPEFQEHIRANTVGGTTIESIRLTDIPNWSVRLPDLATQRTIAHILGTLDDKIELNRRMSETLEAMARALFKSWFVDFDPVRAKAEGRDTGLPKEIADLFPDRFVDSELGEIPEGWGVVSLLDLARFLNGLALQKYPPTADRSLPVIKIAQLRAGDAIGADRASADLDPDFIVRDGDILFSWSGSLECVLWAGGKGALNQHLFKVTSLKYPRWLCYLGVHSHLDEFRYIAAGKATTMGHIQRHHLADAKLVLPPSQQLHAMSEQFEPLIELLWKRAVESRTLAALRDALLPRLVSGELSTPKRVAPGEGAAS